MSSDALNAFHPAVRDWFTASFQNPTRAQELGWPAIAKGEWTLIFAPTGSGKTLTAFLWALNQLMFTAGGRVAASGERETVSGERVTASGKRAAAGKAKGGRARQQQDVAGRCRV